MRVKITNKDLIAYLSHLRDNAEPEITYDSFTKNTIVRDVDINGFRWIISEVIDVLKDS